MGTKFLLLVLSAALITSCSTYRAGQTPDDVYFSPAKEYEAKHEREVRREDKYQDYISAEDERYLRMKIQNRERWSTIDDFDYWNNPYNSRYYSYNPYGHSSPYNNSIYYPYNRPAWNMWGLNNGYNSFGWNTYGWRGNYNYLGYGYAGDYPTVIVKNPIRATSNVGRPSLGGYRNNGYNNTNRSTLGETLGKIFSSSGSSVNSGYNNSNNNSYRSSSYEPRSSSYESPSRSYNPSSSGSTQSSSSGSSSSGSTGTTRPPR